jgi:hypothetical protein
MSYNCIISVLLKAMLTKDYCIISNEFVTQSSVGESSVYLKVNSSADYMSRL